MLPPELIHHIVSFCARSSLPALALAHRRLQGAAEGAMYRTIYVHIAPESPRYPSADMKCLTTLATNPKKAALVRFIDVQFFEDSRSFDDAYEDVYQNLEGAFANTRYLVELRFMLDIEHWGTGLLRAILREHKFEKLQILYCPFDMDFKKLLAHQNALRLVGVLALQHDIQNRCLRPLLESLKDTQSRSLQSSSPATIFGWARDTFDEFINPEEIYIFPEFLGHLQFSQLEACRIFLDGTSSLSFAIADSFNDEAICQFGEYMIPISGNLRKLTFLFHHEIQLDDDKVKRAIAMFPDIDLLGFRLWPDAVGHWPSTPEIDRGRKMSLVKEWASVAPHLEQVTFMDGTTLERQTTEKPWRQYPFYIQF
ncbi:hypothetical protein D9613_006704 [Agrocybe pediades]|uniref:F-box domain-containing protein n=1 Tax=Agrocybe pediades TaxID=84607 RepID=A0A8H4VIB6_9AGAR|nr:hypothetical protein D9613_006704 [Agrocybe pediades]